MQISSLYLHLVFYKIFIFIKCGEIALFTLTLLTPSALLKQSWNCQNSLGQTVATSLGGALLQITFYANPSTGALAWVQAGRVISI